MDIRRFLKRRNDSEDTCYLHKRSENISGLPERVPQLKIGDCDPPSAFLAIENEPGPSTEVTIRGSKSEGIEYDEFDIGNYVCNEGLKITKDDVKYKVLKTPWVPSKNYNFKQDLEGKGRCFRSQWLNEFSNIAYSAKLKGAFCKYCVLFKPPVHRGLRGNFITRPFKKFQKFHECTRSHISSQWHKDAQISATNFLSVMESKQMIVSTMLNVEKQKTVLQNREKLISIVKTLVLCGTNDLPIRGKTDESSLFKKLLEFRVDAGDLILSNHLDNAAKNAKYISHRIQNEILTICADVLTSKIVEEANSCFALSIIADESADISGTEQLSLAIRFILKEENKYLQKEEFLGFVPLQQGNAEYISKAIISFLRNIGLDTSKVVGQGYDGCAVMAGKIGGVQKLVREELPLATFFHCSSHILNLVVNDLNEVSDVRNAVGTVKEVISFFRESNLRRKLIPNIPLFCETRWTSKYKSIRIFKEHFGLIVQSLGHLALESNKNTKQRAFQLYHTVTSSSFIVCLCIMAKYAALLEPVSNKLQGVENHLFAAKEQVQVLLKHFKTYRSNADMEFQKLFQRCLKVASDIDVGIRMPRLCSHQTQRNNIPSDTTEDYFRKSVYIPYMDSLISSLELRFSNDNEPGFLLFALHPKHIQSTTKEEYVKRMKNIISCYGPWLDNFETESDIWYDIQINGNPNIDFFELLEKCEFYPSIRRALIIALSFPATTCTVERSFSTMRRVKTWLRSTMMDERLSSLCMMSVHREKCCNTEAFINDVIDRFGRDDRKLQFVFKQ